MGANPYDVPYVVGEHESPLTYNRVCYYAGDTIYVKQNDIGCFLEDLPEAEPLDCCFPEYCVGPEGVPFAGHRVNFVVPAGGVAVLPIPVIEGCNPPGRVCFFFCSSCLWLGVDADPVVDAEDPVSLAGGGAFPNPICIDLTGCEETLHLATDDATDVKGTLMFYC